MKRRGWRQGIGAIASTVLILLLGCGPDPNGPGSYQAVMQAAASAEETLKGQGATLERKQYPPGAAWAVNLSGKQVTDETFTALRNLDHVAELDLSGTNVADAHMQHLGDVEIAGLLVRLDLSNTTVGDEGLRLLKESLYLSDLNLAGSKVTEAGAAQWQKDRDADPRVRPEFKKTKLSR
jgi:hypothetical protein